MNMPTCIKDHLQHLLQSIQILTSFTFMLRCAVGFFQELNSWNTADNKHN